MIYVTQGYERSIGLEVFIKAFMMLSEKHQKTLLLVCNRDSLLDTLKSLRFKYTIKKNCVEIGSQVLNCFFTPASQLSQTLDSLEYALKVINPQKDLLFTLPSTKDQFKRGNTTFSGHTEYFRSRYSMNDLCMVFKGLFSPDILLISDHIPLKDVSQYISKELIIKKVSICIQSYSESFTELKNIFFSGINPHSGEGGLIGHEDQVVAQSISKLKADYNSVDFHGPYSGDTVVFEQAHCANPLLVYMSHDQGLGTFKALNQLVGINMTLGLPFLRLSVDHGTACPLYKKNKANYQGCLFGLQFAIQTMRNKSE